MTIKILNSVLTVRDENIIYTTQIEIVLKRIENTIKETND